MGCDIHVHVEYRRNICTGKADDGSYQFEERWFCGDYFSLNPFFTTGDEEEKQYQLVRFCEGRNYARFATLANVRNYGGTPYISEPRGLPIDVTEAVRMESESWGADGHSHSYLTLRELIDFKNRRIPLKHRGMISPEAQRQLDIGGILPTEWCQMTNQPGWQFREWESKNDTLDELIEAMKIRADDVGLIYDWQWEKSPQRAYENTDKIRIVFWFDN